ncbi:MULTISPECIES: LysR family transcriptional regulator [unclassified Streptomyces]|uniref:LysR family transcriptional regulator n=1 Tax=unclassified Streptomyces TaxID=2593676 RepID=UPI002E337528|nr:MULTISPECIES: LysR family transcriptional regulator [unclassified Streptomyces]
MRDGPERQLDLNLLVALDALLEEGSVTGAAARLHVSAPAMSRTLGRIRTVLRDPVLVRAGRELVPTPRAVELRPRVRALVHQAHALLVPEPVTDPARLTREFTVQAGEMLLPGLAPRLVRAVVDQAPGVTLRFMPEALEGTPALREGRLDLEIGVIGHPDPETRIESLGRTRLLAAVRAGHPLARRKTVTARAFAAADHVGVSRQGRVRGPVDDRLGELGLSRPVVAVVPSWSAALFLCRESDLVCLTPACAPSRPHELLGLHTFEVPLELPPVALGMAWHPRNDADPGHGWLRDRVRESWRAGGFSG